MLSDWSHYVGSHLALYICISCAMTTGSGASAEVAILGHDNFHQLFLEKDHHMLLHETLSWTNDFIGGLWIQCIEWTKSGRTYCIMPMGTHFLRGPMSTIQLLKRFKNALILIIIFTWLHIYKGSSLGNMERSREISKTGSFRDPLP